MTVKYAAERVTVDSANLAAWSAWVNADTMYFAGPCPVCGHDSPNSIPLKISALEVTAAPQRALTVALVCTCEQQHPGRPDSVPRGCGRNWSLTATRDADDKTVRLSPLTDPTLVAAAQALRDAAPRQLTELRGAAGKWIAGVTALYGLFGLAGISITRNTVASLAVGWQIGIAVSAVAAIALAGLAIYWIYRAAYGWPTVRSVRNDDELREWYSAQLSAPAACGAFLRTGVRTAAASLAVLAVTTGLLWFAPGSPASPLVRVTLADGAQVCGPLLPATGGQPPGIRVADNGAAIDIPASEIREFTPVVTCLSLIRLPPGESTRAAARPEGSRHCRRAGRAGRGAGAAMASGTRSPGASQPSSREHREFLVPLRQVRAVGRHSRDLPVAGPLPRS